MVATCVSDMYDAQISADITETPPFYHTFVNVGVIVINGVSISMFQVIKTVLSSGYILILLSIEYILASLIETCQG